MKLSVLFLTALLATLAGLLIRLLSLLIVFLTAALAALLVLLLIGRQVTPCWGCQGQRRTAMKRSFADIILH